MNELAPLVRSSLAQGTGSIVADRRRALSLPEVLEEATGVAALVRRASTRAVPVVAVRLPASLDAVVHLVAGILDDHVLVFLDPTDATRAATVVDAVDADVVVDAAGVHPRRVLSSRGWQPGYVAMSSGSTGGPPKGVLSSWDALAEFVPHGSEVLQVDQTARWAEPNHPAYDLAITNWILALGSGASLHVGGALADRLRPLRLAARVEATHVRLAPRYVDLARAEWSRGTPCVVRVWGSGGDRLGTPHAEQVLGFGVSSLVNTYGTSESGGFASAASYSSTDDLRTADGTVSVGDGSVGPWRVEVEREVVQGAACDVLSVRSPHLGDGYVFGGHDQDYPRWEPDRLVTGDVGRRVGRDIFCLGRAGRLVKRSASFVNLDDVDAALRLDRGLDSFTVVLRDGSLVTLVEGAGEGTAALRERLRTLVPPHVVPDAIVDVDQLPRLANGKTDQAGAIALAESAGT